MFLLSGYFLFSDMAWCLLNYPANPTRRQIMIKIAVVVLSTVLFLKAQHALLGEADPFSILEGVALVLLGPLFSVMLSHPQDALRDNFV